MTPNLAAFLAVIRACEGTSGPNGYRTHFAGSLFESYDDHPRKAITSGRYTSTAAGAYQILARTWDGFVAANGPHDFSPASQDLCARWLIGQRGATADVEAGRLRAALAKCNREWASLPGAPYGQPTRTVEYCERIYHLNGGVQVDGAEILNRPQTDPIEGPATQPAAPIEERSIPPLPQPTPERKPMAPLIPVILKLLAGALPVVSTIFGPRGEISERNVRLAQVVVDTAVRATDSINAQEAAEKIAADAEAAARANAALAAQPDVAAYLAVVSPIIERQAAYEAQARADSRGDANDSVVRKNPTLVTQPVLAKMILGAMFLVGLAMVLSMGVLAYQVFLSSDGKVDAFIASLATMAFMAITSIVQAPFRSIFGAMFTSEAASTAGGVVDTSRQQLGAKQ
jgi:muramidase (phage lysozyme)